MAVEFDSAKDAINRRKHGFSLAQAEEFDFVSAVITEDTSEAYGEQRLRAVGVLPSGGVVVLVFVDLGGDDIRAISLRNAEPRERRAWRNR